MHKVQPCGFSQVASLNVCNSIVSSYITPQKHSIQCESSSYPVLASVWINVGFSTSSISTSEILSAKFLFNLTKKSASLGAGKPPAPHWAVKDLVIVTKNTPSSIRQSVISILPIW